MPPAASLIPQLISHDDDDDDDDDNARSGAAAVDGGGVDKLGRYNDNLKRNNNNKSPYRNHETSSSYPSSSTTFNKIPISTKQRRVRFDDKNIRTKEIPHRLNTYTEKEKLLCWYTSQELEQIRSENKRVLMLSKRKMSWGLKKIFQQQQEEKEDQQNSRYRGRGGSMGEYEHDLCNPLLTGLERRTKDGQRRYRANVTAGIRAVLMEQKIQRASAMSTSRQAGHRHGDGNNHGLVQVQPTSNDDEMIRLVYSTVTQSCSKIAGIRALKIAVSVMEIDGDGEYNNSDQHYYMEEEKRNDSNKVYEI